VLRFNRAPGGAARPATAHITGNRTTARFITYAHFMRGHFFPPEPLRPKPMTEENHPPLSAAEIAEMGVMYMTGGTSGLMCESGTKVHDFLKYHAAEIQGYELIDNAMKDDFQHFLFQSAVTACEWIPDKLRRRMFKAMIHDFREVGWMKEFDGLCEYVQSQMYWHKWGVTSGLFGSLLGMATCDSISWVGFAPWVFPKEELPPAGHYWADLPEEEPIGSAWDIVNHDPPKADFYKHHFTWVERILLAALAETHGAES